MNGKATRQRSMDTLHHIEHSVDVPASAEAVFAYADDWTELSAHMGQASWKMGGGKMQVDTDSGRGRMVGSHVRLTGKAFGIGMSLEEVVTERVPPWRKTWETIGEPRLLVIGHYRMGFEITQHAQVARLTVFIEYALPEGMPGRWLGTAFGASYARWCTRQMAVAVAKHFGSKAR